MMTVSQNKLGCRYSSDRRPRGGAAGACVGSAHRGGRQAEVLGNLGARLGEAALRHEPAHRFRHIDPNQHADDCRRHTEHRNSAPAERLEQRGGGAGSEKAAGGGENQIKARQQGPVPRRRQLDLDRQRRGDPGGQPDPDKEAQHREDLPRAGRNDAHQPGARGADEGADDHRDLASPGIGQPAKDERAEDGADAAAIEDHRRLAVGEVPLRRQHGKQVADDEKIEEFEDEQRREQDERSPNSAD